MTEQEMREATVPTFDTPEALSAYIELLRTQDHDYGTCLYAMSMAAVAAFNYMARALGATGFQASCADMDVLTRTRRMEGPWAILDANKMLYPQYSLTEDVEDYIACWLPWASEEAKKKLLDENNSHAHPDVIGHWKKLAGEQ